MEKTIAAPPAIWQESIAKTVTFVVTEDCQLRCHYCYLVGKNSRNKMSFDIAKRTIDHLVENRDLFPDKAVVWDFIGGEPFLEVDLIDRICDYAREKMAREEHPWLHNYRFSLTTNGILYGTEKAQYFIRKNRSDLSIGVTIDGTPQKHDMHRVYPSGKGSYNDTASNIPLWIEQFPVASTKVTVASDDLPYIRESVLHLYAIGIKHISINVVFEDVWKDGDDMILEDELIGLADAMIGEGLYREHTCSFFSETIGRKRLDNNNWCGAGRMLAVDYKGDFYPCHRFTPFSLVNKKAPSIGNCFEGIDGNRLRPYLSLDLITQSPAECVTCDVATGCAWCQGANYDLADTETIYQRATYLCKMHKARVRANNYYWHRLRQGG
ncbi:MAG: radical protein [Deltaproteobacteria bacterium]|nr:radical protein [Deltaproteobacteria bacterium]